MNFIEERKHRRSNRINPLPDNARQQRVSFIAMGVIRRKNPSNGGNHETNNSEHEEHDTANMPKNNAIYNPNLIDVAHIAILSVVIGFCLAKVDMMKSIHSKETIEDHSRLLLFMLDVSPEFFISVIFPLMIIARKKEMRKWIKSFFRNQ